MTKKHLYFLLAGFITGALCGFFVGKGIYHTTEGVKVERDTVCVRDTVFDYQPAPVDSARVRYLTRYLPVVNRDTVTQVEVVAMHDSVLVEVPITSKHYSAKEYDAWVSGYEPSLDSIFVYREKQIITETITRTVKENKHFFLDVNGGCAYQVNRSRYMPFAELRLTFKKGRWGIGASGGYVHDSSTNTASPYGKAVLSYDIVSF